MALFNALAAKVLLHLDSDEFQHLGCCPGHGLPLSAVDP